LREWLLLVVAFAKRLACAVCDDGASQKRRYKFGVPVGTR
jgi:hypothetical protein